jgi:hypothetical protein
LVDYRRHQIIMLNTIALKVKVWFLSGEAWCQISRTTTGCKRIFAISRAKLWFQHVEVGQWKSGHLIAHNSVRMVPWVCMCVSAICLQCMCIVSTTESKKMINTMCIRVREYGRGECINNYWTLSPASGRPVTKSWMPFCSTEILIK